MVVAWHVPGVHSVDDESDASHRRRRELGRHLHGDFYDAASSDSASLAEPAVEPHLDSDVEAYAQAPPPFRRTCCRRRTLQLVHRA